MTFKEQLKSHGCDYNLREMANIYAGSILGALAPIVALRYTFMNDLPENMPVYIREPAAWAISTVASCIPLGRDKMPLIVYGFATGSFVGGLSAHQLRRERAKKEMAQSDEPKPLEGRVIN